MGRFGGGGLGNNSVGGGHFYQINWLCAAGVGNFVLMGVMTVGKSLT